MEPQTQQTQQTPEIPFSMDPAKPNVAESLAAVTATAAAGGNPIRVVVTAPEGIYYRHRIWREGEALTLEPMYVSGKDEKTGQPKRTLITAEKQFSARTMRKVKETPE